MNKGIKVVNWGEEIRKEIKIWEKTYSIGHIFYCGKYKGINIKWEGHEYFIELSRIATPEEAFHWICHMTEKCWFTPQILYDFIKILKRITTLNEYCNPSMWKSI